MSRIYRTLGTVAMTPKGEFDASAYYEYLNIVEYEGSSYVAKQDVHDVLPTNDTYWLYLGGGVKITDTLYVFDTVAAMKASTKLKNGFTVQTLGYYSVNDGGGATYKITNTASGTNHQEAVGSLYATLILGENVTPEMFGAYGDNTHDDTIAINTALQYCDTLNFLSKTYLIKGNDANNAGNLIHSAIDYNGGILLKSNQTLKGNNTILKSLDETTSYNIIRIYNCDNIIIDNINIVGNRDTQSGTGEYGHGIMVLNSANVKIVNCNISKNYGDNIYVGVLFNSSATKETKNIFIDNCIIDNARRNGIACGSGDNIIISNNVISTTTGTAPQSGIDIESEGSSPKLSNITIENNNFYDNVYGLSIPFNNTNVDFNSINIIGNTFKSTHAFDLMIYTFADFDNIIRGNINIENNSFIEAGWSSIIIRDFYSDKFDNINIKNAYILNCNNVNHNTNNNSEGWRNGSGLVVFRNSDVTSKVGNVYVENLEVIDDRETKYINKAFVVVDSTDSHTENIQLINPIRLDCINGITGMKNTIIQDIKELIYSNGTYYSTEFNIINNIPVYYTSGVSGDLKAVVLNDDNGYIPNGTKLKVVNDGGKKTQIKCGLSALMTVYNSPDPTKRYIRCTASDTGAYIVLQKINGIWCVIEKQGNWTSSDNSF